MCMSDVIDASGMWFDEGWKSIFVAGGMKFVGYLTRLCKRAWECVWHRSEDLCCCRMCDSWAKLLEDEWRTYNPSKLWEIVLDKSLVKDFHIWQRGTRLATLLKLAEWKVMWLEKYSTSQAGRSTIKDLSASSEQMTGTWSRSWSE